MIFEEYGNYDGIGLAELVTRGEVSPRDLVDSAIDVIERRNPDVNCVVQQLRDQALAEIRRGLPHGPFRGVPFLVKEFGMHFKGMKTSAGSRLAAGVTFDADTELMKRCRNAGLVTVGTTTTPEMAFNANSEAVVYGSTRNPWNLGHSVGGSSGGAGAAVASGMVPIAHANDGGGSIRIPGACNGVVGMKPSRGRTPTGPDAGIFLWGLAIEFAETRSVRDSAALLDAVAGPDDGYFYCALPPRRSFLAAAMTPPDALRIGVLDQLPGTARASREYRDRLADTVKLLEGLGHVCEPVKIKYDADAFNESTIRLWAVTLGYFMDAFASMTGRKIGPKTVEAVTLEVYRYAHKLKAIEMEWAMGVQNQVSRSVGAVMRDYDVLLTPGLGREVAKLGELNQNAKGVGMMDWWKQLMYDYTQFTPLFNTTGQPAVMLPLWQSKAGLPMAMQFVGRMADEETLYSLAGQLEQAQPWAARRPPIYA
ncbi:MAG: amidase [Gammaproteobacteria bacterium]|nr:amidase [Gammaproteobacteria bacterium]MCP5200176.1 amidase [Gammaproteobacteria bacterium]